MLACFSHWSACGGAQEECGLSMRSAASCISYFCCLIGYNPSQEHTGAHRSINATMMLTALLLAVAVAHSRKPILVHDDKTTKTSMETGARSHFRMAQNLKHYSVAGQVKRGCKLCYERSPERAETQPANSQTVQRWQATGGSHLHLDDGLVSSSLLY